MAYQRILRVAPIDRNLTFGTRRPFKLLQSPLLRLGLEEDEADEVDEGEVRGVIVVVVLGTEVADGGYPRTDCCKVRRKNGRTSSSSWNRYKASCLLLERVVVRSSERERAYAVSILDGFLAM